MALGRVAVGERMLTLPVHWPHAAPSPNTIHLPKSSFPSLPPSDDTTDGRNSRLNGEDCLGFSIWMLHRLTGVKPCCLLRADSLLYTPSSSSPPAEVCFQASSVAQSVPKSLTYNNICFSITQRTVPRSPWATKKSPHIPLCSLGS